MLARRSSRVDINVATVYSAIGSILLVGTVEALTGSCDLSKLIFNVQGCGKVGSIVAKKLVRFRALKLQTCDLFPEAANSGCTPIIEWATTCSCGYLVSCVDSCYTEEVANFPEGIKYYTVGATSAPFRIKKQKIYSMREMLCIFLRLLVQLFLFLQIVWKGVAQLFHLFYDATVIPCMLILFYIFTVAWYLIVSDS